MVRGHIVGRFKPWFDFRGRISRVGYWRATLRLTIFGALIWLLGLSASLVIGAWAAPFFLLFLPLIVAATAITIQRLHDRGRSIIWAFIFLVLPTILVDSSQAPSLAKAIGVVPLSLGVLAALILNIWGFVEISFLRQSPRADRYGAARNWPSEAPLART
jgi:uncharacterized membrane protein YhaH (DUF805 family)